MLLRVMPCVALSVVLVGCAKPSSPDPPATPPAAASPASVASGKGTVAGLSASEAQAIRDYVLRHADDPDTVTFEELELLRRIPKLPPGEERTIFSPPDADLLARGRYRTKTKDGNKKLYDKLFLIKDEKVTISEVNAAGDRIREQFK